MSHVALFLPSVVSPGVYDQYGMWAYYPDHGQIYIIQLFMIKSVSDLENGEDCSRYLFFSFLIKNWVIVAMIVW